MTQLTLIPLHTHGRDCYASNASGPLAYTPYRADGADRNRQNYHSVDFETAQRVASYALELGRGNGTVRGLTLTCGKIAVAAPVHPIVQASRERTAWELRRANIRRS